MAKERKDITFSDRQPPVIESNPPAEVPTPPVEEAKPTAPLKITAMNVSATLLHLEDGTPFPPRATAELSQADFKRFTRFNLISIKS
jgi:hypothetical protein